MQCKMICVDSATMSNKLEVDKRSDTNQIKNSIYTNFHSM